MCRADARVGVRRGMGTEESSGMADGIASVVILNRLDGAGEERDFQYISLREREREREREIFNIIS